jgi:hypothetical protein
MTYALERSAIETYFQAAWAGATPVGFDAQAFTPAVGSVLLTINSGAVMQGSIGRLLNRIDHIGTVVISIYTEGGKGSAAWRALAETAVNIFFEKTIDTAGVLITGASTAFVRFSPPEVSPAQHPYISASFAAPPFHITNVTAPFVRYSFK